MQIEVGYDIHFRMQTKHICIISSFQPLVKIRQQKHGTMTVRAGVALKFGQGKNIQEATDIKADKQVSFL
jgi:hypothetical protein